MSWFRRFFGLGKEGDEILSLKLRLNRFRHFLRTQWMCEQHLADLREKYQGDYIFDRHYIFSTVGQVFQKAYQMIYDGFILNNDRESDLYQRLDQIKAKTQALFTSFAKDWENHNGGASSKFPSINSKAGGNNSIPLDEEPEYRMLRKVIEQLDPPEPDNTHHWPNTFDEVDNLQRALGWIHRQVLGTFIKPEAIEHWKTTGLAFPLLKGEGLSLYAVDLEMKISPHPKGSQEKISLREGPLYSGPWGFFINALSAPLEEQVQAVIKEKSPLFLIYSSNALFLYGTSEQGTLMIDMVLTSIQELNHFFFHWQAGSGDSPFFRNLSSICRWTPRQGERVFEFLASKRPFKEITNYAVPIGKALNFWWGRT